MTALGIAAAEHYPRLVDELVAAKSVIRAAPGWTPCW
jgi:hypothetical protein